LREIRERVSGGADDFARVGLFQSGDDAQESRFARAVRADDADLVRIFETELDVFEKRLDAVIFETDSSERIFIIKSYKNLCVFAPLREKNSFPQRRKDAK
jgi:hypothetical protein